MVTVGPTCWLLAAVVRDGIGPPASGAEASEVVLASAMRVSETKDVCMEIFLVGMFDSRAGSIGFRGRPAQDSLEVIRPAGPSIWPATP
jgi:hypothetical protein